MSFIVYSCITPEGFLVWRTGTFADVTQLLEEVQKRGEILDRYFELPEWINKFAEALRGKLRNLQVAQLCSHLSLYVQSGIDLQTALADLESSVRDARMRVVTGRMRRDLMTGWPLSKAMERSGHFPEIVIRMVYIGETSGSLERTLADAASHLERVQDIKSTSLRALLYPAFTATMLFLAVAFWLFVVAPKLAPIYKSMNLELPLVTKLLIGLSESVGSGWTWGVVAIIGAWVAFAISRRINSVRLLFDRIAWKLPVFGNIVRISQEAFFFHYMALVYKAGIPIFDAIGTVISSVSNRYLQLRLSRVPEHLRLGLTLRDAFQRTNAFQPLDVRMIGIGEQTGTLEAQLEKLASHYMQRLRVAVDLLTKSIEPMLVLVLGSIFVFLIVAMMAPFYTLLSETMFQIGGP